MRRVGKIGRRKMFPKVKNVNAESLKKGSKLLDFSQIVLNNLCHRSIRIMLKTECRVY